MLTVRVIQLPGLVKEVALEDGATVQDAMSVAGIEQANGTIKVDGNVATAATAVSDGSTITIAKGPKGNR